MVSEQPGDLDGHALSGIKVTYRIGPEMVAPQIDQTATLTGEGVTVDGGTMNQPGFLRCIATVEQNGKTYRGLATAAFNPEAIQPTQEDPKDFDEFWAAGKAALAKLRKAQTSVGGFPWWPGGPPSPYMTLYLLHGFWGSPSSFVVALKLADVADSLDVPDPYYGGPPGFELVLDLVEEASSGLLAHLLERWRLSSR